MAVYLVMWKLNPNTQGHAERREWLQKRIGRLEHITDPDLESVLFVATEDDHDIGYYLIEHLTRDDRILIVPLKRHEYGGYLSESTQLWLDARAG